jgi:hypothetical protein
MINWRVSSGLSRPKDQKSFIEVLGQTFSGFNWSIFCKRDIEAALASGRGIKGWGAKRKHKQKVDFRRRLNYGKVTRGD